MGRLKNLITDATFELQKKVVKQVQVGRKTKAEEVYTYLDKENGSQLTFHAHPTKAWNWVIVLEETNDQGKLVAAEVIDAFCEAGMHRKRNQTFEDAIKVLKLS